MKSSPLVRVAMAAGMYLLLMWGYSALPNAQWFAAFLALMLSSMLVFWVHEATTQSQESEGQKSAANAVVCDRTTASSASVELATADSASLEASILRLDSLKGELTRQYAQFGRDQSLINSNALGSWHKTRKPQGR